jgi:hypothetical protein
MCKRLIVIGFVIVSFCCHHVQAIEKIYNPKYRRPHLPYITGDAFRSYADHIFDETKPYFSPELVQAGDTVFVKGDMIDLFFEKYHSGITNTYILITHNSDQEISKKYFKYLNEDKLATWFAQNVIDRHPKLISIPLGLENNYINDTKISLLESVKNRCLHLQKSILLYQNFALATSEKERNYVKNLFASQPYCFCAQNLSLSQYFSDIISSYFILSPRGNGIDCHRTWEVLYLGAIPIVKSSAMDPMYEDLPVLIINQWTDINEAFLHEQYQKLNQGQYNLYKLDMQYWFSLIEKVRKSIRK